MHCGELVGDMPKRSKSVTGHCAQRNADSTMPHAQEHGKPLHTTIPCINLWALSNMTGRRG